MKTVRARWNCGIASALTLASVFLGAACSSEVTDLEPRSISFVISPSRAIRSGIPFETQPVLRLGNGLGNNVRRAGVVITAIDVGSGSVVAGGSATTDRNGVATFSGLTLRGIIGSHTLTFSISPTVSVSSDTISLTAGLPVALGMLRQPSTSLVSGTPFFRQPVVQLYDDAGNTALVTDVEVTAALDAGSSAQLIGAVTVLTSETGTATFGSLGISGPAGPQRLTFSAIGAGTVTSDTVSVLAAGGVWAFNGAESARWSASPLIGSRLK